MKDRGQSREFEPFMTVALSELTSKLDCTGIQSRHDLTLAPREQAALRQQRGKGRRGSRQRIRKARGSWDIRWSGKVGNEEGI